MRGGRVILRALQAPEVSGSVSKAVIDQAKGFQIPLTRSVFFQQTEWKSAKNAVESALQLEKGTV